MSVGSKGGPKHSIQLALSFRFRGESLVKQLLLSEFKQPLTPEEVQ
jgi:hypothetical protein